MKNSKESFQVGDKIICVNTDFTNLPPLYLIIFKVPQANEVYTVRGRNSKGAIWLKEIINEVFWFSEFVKDEPGFLEWRFRKVSGSIANKQTETLRRDVVLREAKLAVINEYNVDIKNWFSRLSDNIKLSLFKKRIDTQKPQWYDDVLMKWWMNRY
jgi:hypothetical protein